MSTTYGQSVTASQIINSAAMKLMTLELGATMDATTQANFLFNLNIMIKQWMTEGIKLWTVNVINLPMVQGQTVYYIGTTGPDLVTDRPLRLIQAWYRNNTVPAAPIDTPLTILSRQEYNMLGSKLVQGTFNSIYFEPGLQNAAVSLYVTPDANTQTNFALYMVVQIPIGDATVVSSTMNFPQEWMMALVWGLADIMSMEYGVPAPMRAEITKRAENYRMKLEDWDVEQAPTMFVPDMRSVAGRM